MSVKPAFIFDMDGVIVDSNPWHKIALRRFCEQHGYSLSEEDLRKKIYGRTNRDWIRNLFGDIPEDTLRQYAWEKELLYRQLYEKDIAALPGLTQFLDRLDEHGFRRAIATSAPRENVDFTLDNTGTRKYFNTILDDTFVSKGKPDPEIYLKAADAVDMHPGDCIVLEDSLAGIQAARAAGCKVIGLATTHDKEELASSVDLVLADFQQATPAQLVHRLFVPMS